MTPTHPDFSQLLPALQQVGVALTLVMGALLVAIKALDYLTRMLLTFAPQNRVLVVADHWLSFLAMRWPVTPVPPAPGTTLTTSTVVSTPPAPVLTVTPAPPPANPAPAPAAPTATGGAGLLVLACLLGLSGVARAQSGWAPRVSTGPALSLLEYRAGFTHPASASPGLGYALQLGWLPDTIAGQTADMLTLSLDAFGSVISDPAGVNAGNLSVALILGTWNGVLGVGLGVDVWGAAGGLVGGFSAANNLYPVLCLHIPMGFAGGATQGGEAKPRSFGEIDL